jgi:hypothetical protein
MIEYRTGPLSLDELEAEILAMTDDPSAAGIDTAYVTYGFGCDRFDLIQPEAIPVAVHRLAWFVADSEARGVYELGEADLEIAGGGVTYTLCHEHDVHCAGPQESGLLQAVRERWRSRYPDC